jgi:carbon monoxide dehydrogenase subunit G
MELKGDFLFDAPQHLVWEAVQDPQVLGSVMPGGQGFETVAPNQYKGTMSVKVGPVQGVFDAAIKLSDVVAPTSYTIDVDGKGAPGFVKANGSMTLEARGDQTYLEYAGTANIGGKIASVGQRLIDSTARSIVRQALEGLNEYLKVKAAEESAEKAVASVSESAHAEHTESHKPESTSSETPTYMPPSQTQVAFNVMRDVFNDTVPEQYQPVLAILVAGVIITILWQLFT